MDVLVVDDDPFIAKAIQRLLRERGAEMVRVATLADARAFVARLRADAALIDVGLPDGNGADFARELRRSWLGVPIALLTGMLAPEALNYASTPGISLIAKPPISDAIARFLDSRGDFARDVARSVELAIVRMSREADLSARELEFLRFLVEGGRPVEFAASRSISRNTLKDLSERLRRKLALSQLTELWPAILASLSGDGDRSS